MSASRCAFFDLLSPVAASCEFDSGFFALSVAEPWLCPFAKRAPFGAIYRLSFWTIIFLHWNEDMKTQPNSVSSGTPKRISEGQLGEMLRRYLPGPIVTDGSEKRSASTQLLLRQGNDDYSPWSSRPDHISTWAPDRFESDLERDCVVALHRFEIEDWVTEQFPPRYFN